VDWAGTAGGRTLAALVPAEDGPNPLFSATGALPEWTTFLAVAFGALAGAAFAARRGFDIVGVFGLATAQGIGGLLLGSILLATGTPAVLLHSGYLVIVAAAAGLGFFFAGLIARTVQSLLLVDALSLGLLCAIGTNSALRGGLDYVPAAFIGLVTAVGGLILRDILAGRAPEVLRPGTYIAAAALIGTLVFVLLVDFGATRSFAQLATVAVVATIRVLSVLLGWHTHEPKDLSDRVWRFWGLRDQREKLDPVTRAMDRTPGPP
jgi:uncharacterized membrane protein YeiH